MFHWRGSDSASRRASRARPVKARTGPPGSARTAPDPTSTGPGDAAGKPGGHTPARGSAACCAGSHLRAEWEDRPAWPPPTGRRPRAGCRRREPPTARPMPAAARPAAVRAVAPVEDRPAARRSAHGPWRCDVARTREWSGCGDGPGSQSARALPSPGRSSRRSRSPRWSSTRVPSGAICFGPIAAPSGW